MTAEKQPPLSAYDQALVDAGWALHQAKTALGALVCPFAMGTDLTITGGNNPQMPSLKANPIGQELASLAGVRRMGERGASWLDNPVIVFHIDRIEFNHGIDNNPLNIETLANRWFLLGHIRDDKGNPKSGEALLSLSCNTLKDRMKLLPTRPQVSTTLLASALDQYEQARTSWMQLLDAPTPDPGLPDTRRHSIGR